MKVKRTNNRCSFLTCIQPSGHWRNAVTVDASKYGTKWRKACVRWVTYSTDSIEEVKAFRDALNYGIQEAKRIDAKIAKLEGNTQ